MRSAVSRNFGEHLRWWRRRRGLSQLELAGVAGTSQRHLSFLESGRAAPSQPMVLSLAAALNVSLRQQNAFLGSAGYAPIWREGRLGEPELAQVDGALAHVLAQQEPYPAFVVDRHWNLRRANQGAARLVEFLLGAVREGPVESGGCPPVTCCHAAVRRELGGGRPPFHPRRTGRSHRGRLVRIVRVAHAPARPMKACPSYARSAAVEDAPRPLLPIHLRKAGISLHLFTTIATLGTPQDITVQEIRIESYLPDGRADGGLLP